MKAREYKERSMLCTLVLGAMALIFALAIDVAGLRVDDRILWFLFEFGALMLFATLFQYILYRRGPDIAMGDERTQKLAGLAMFYTWLLSLLFIFILLALDYLEVVKMSVFTALSLSLAFMFATGFGLCFIFWTRGDME